MENTTLHTFLADFGLARILTSSGNIGSKTMKCGTPGFQSPEQLKGNNISCKADMYALGGVIVELFGGRPLWGDLQPLQIMYKVGVEGKMPDTVHLPPEIEQVATMCLEEETKRASAIKVLKLLIDLARK